MKFINDPLLELNDYRGTLRTMVGEATVSNEGLADSLRFLIPSTVDVLNSLYFSGNVPRMAQAAKARIEDLTTRHAYSEMRGQFVQVPSEISVTYLAYAEILKQAASHARQFEKTMLEPFGELVAKLVVDSSGLKTSDDQAAARLFAKSHRDELSKALAKVSNDGNSNHKRYSDMVARNADWSELFKHMDAIADDLNEINHDRIMRAISAIKTQLTVLLKRIDDEQIETSPEALVNIADGVYELAREAEFVSLVTTRAIGLQTAVNDTIARLYLKLN